MRLNKCCLFWRILWAILLVTRATVAEHAVSNSPRPVDFGLDPFYTQLVTDDRLEDAVEYVCQKFSLKCSGITIVRQTTSDEEKGAAYATTSPITNTITVYKTAFMHPMRTTPHPGWLAAVLLHEMTHQKQSRYLRMIASPQTRVMANPIYLAQLEYDGWNIMLKNAERFKLSCSMRLIIEENLYFFAKVIEYGAIPKTSNDEERFYTLTTQQRKAIINRCEGL